MLTKLPSFEECVDKNIFNILGNLWIDNWANALLFVHYLPSHMMTGMPLDLQMLCRPSRDQMSIWSRPAKED